MNVGQVQGMADIGPGIVHEVPQQQMQSQHQQQMQSQHQHQQQQQQAQTMQQVHPPAVQYGYQNSYLNSGGGDQTEEAMKGLTEDTTGMTEEEIRRVQRNRREQERSHRIALQIKDLRSLLSESNIPFKPTKYSILSSVVDYVRNLQDNATRLDGEHKKLIQTIQQANDLVNTGQATLLPDFSSTHAHVQLCDTSLTGSSTAGIPMHHQRPPDMVTSAGLLLPNYTRHSHHKTSSAAASAPTEVDYRFIFEQCCAALAVAALDGRFIDCNSEFERLSGYTREELKNPNSRLNSNGGQATLFNLLSPQDMEGVFRVLGKMLVEHEEPSKSTKSTSTAHQQPAPVTSIGPSTPSETVATQQQQQYQTTHGQPLMQYSSPQLIYSAHQQMPLIVNNHVAAPVYSAQVQDKPSSSHQIQMQYSNFQHQPQQALDVQQPQNYSQQFQYGPVLSQHTSQVNQQEHAQPSRRATIDPIPIYWSGEVSSTIWPANKDTLVIGENQDRLNLSPNSPKKLQMNITLVKSPQGQPRFFNCSLTAMYDSDAEQATVVTESQSSQGGMTTLQSSNRSELQNEDFAPHKRPRNEPLPREQISNVPMSYSTGIKNLTEPPGVNGNINNQQMDTLHQPAPHTIQAGTPMFYSTGLAQMQPTTTMRFTIVGSQPNAVMPQGPLVQIGPSHSHTGQQGTSPPNDDGTGSNKSDGHNSNTSSSSGDGGKYSNDTSELTSQSG